MLKPSSTQLRFACTITPYFRHTLTLFNSTYIWGKTGERSFPCFRANLRHHKNRHPFVQFYYGPQTSKISQPSHTVRFLKNSSSFARCTTYPALAKNILLSAIKLHTILEKSNKLCRIRVPVLRSGLDTVVKLYVFATNHKLMFIRGFIILVGSRWRTL